jgi:hypothetical protein
VKLTKPRKKERKEKEREIEEKKKKGEPKKTAGRDGGRSNSIPDSQTFKGRQKKKKITSSGTLGFQS